MTFRSIELTHTDDPEIFAVASLTGPHRVIIFQHPDRSVVDHALAACRLAFNLGRTDEAARRALLTHVLQTGNPVP